MALPMFDSAQSTLRNALKFTQLNPVENLKMKIDRRFRVILVITMLAMSLSACEKPGPAETAGKQIDKAAESVTHSLNNTIHQTEKALKN